MEKGQRHIPEGRGGVHYRGDHIPVHVVTVGLVPLPRVSSSRTGIGTSSQRFSNIGVSQKKRNYAL